MSISEFLARYGVLVGCGLMAIALLWVGYAVGIAIEGLKHSFTQLSETVSRSADNLKEDLHELNETMDSLHRLFGGRKWQDDELEKDLTGPTIQRLLQSIDRHLTRLAPENPNPKQTGFILPTKTPKRD